VVVVVVVAVAWAGLRGEEDEGREAEEIVGTLVPRIERGARREPESAQLAPQSAQLAPQSAQLAAALGRRRRKR
jgi:hypothetical protein